MRLSYRAALKSPKMQAPAAGSLSGLLAYLAFPPADQGWLGFFALAPLAWYFRRAESGRRFAWASSAFSLVFFGLLISWIGLFGRAAYIGLVLAQSLWMVAALGAGFYVKAGLKDRGWGLIVFPVAFLAGEYLRSHLPLGGFGWGGLGYTQHDNLLALKLSPYTGVWGISFSLALVSSLVAEGLTHLRRQTVKTAAALAGAAAIALAPAALPAQEPDGKTIRVAMVQGNVPENTFDPRSDDLTVLQNHLRLTRSIPPGKAGLIIWPEGAFDTDPLGDDRFGEPLVEIVRQQGVPFLVGAILPSDQGEGKIRNSTLFLTPQGEVAGIYSKQHPVPFGEYVPFRKVLSPLFKELERVPRDQVPGEESTVFGLPQGNVASVICYESTYPGLVRSFVQNGARLLVVSTNDSSFERSAASEQHVAFSRLRAAEHRMWVAHTAVSGVSAVIRPDGAITQKSELFEPALFVPAMRFATQTTFYAKTGDWLPAAVLAALGLGLASELLKKMRDEKVVNDGSAGGRPTSADTAFPEAKPRQPTF